MRYSNLHTHTVFSDGKNTMEENIRAAVEKNMLSLGFSDHSHTPCDLSYCMGKERYGEYLRELERWKKEAPLPIYAGLELDADSEDDLSPYDYIIASVHYLKVKGVCYPVDHEPWMQRDCIRDGFGGDTLAMLRCYYETLGDHVARVKPTFVGHFDLPAKFSAMPEEADAYRTLLTDAMQEILKLCPYIELNTGAMAKGIRKTPYPAPWLLDTVRDHGGRIVLSSDSHRAEHLTYWFDEAAELLKTHGIHQIYVFNGTGLDPVELEALRSNFAKSNLE